MAFEEKYNFKKFVQRIYIYRDINEVYGMWANIELIEKWYVVSASYHTSDGRLREKKDCIQTNDEYEWTWVDGAKLHGKILEAHEKGNIKFTFGSGIEVSVSFSFNNGRTLVELKQDQNLNDWEMNFQNYMACFPGWLFYLVNLKSVCEGGLDLREINPDVDLLVNI